MDPVELTCDVVLFDLDGTLVDSTPVVDRIWTDLARALGREPADVVGRFHGMQAGAAMLMVDPTLTPERVEELRAYVIAEELRDLEGVHAIPGAADLVAALPADAWAVVTSCPRDLALARLGAAGLPVPAVLVTADDVSAGKPDPAPFALGAHLAGVDPARSLAVEDAPAGITSAQGAGCQVLGILSTHDTLPVPAVRDLRAVRVVDASGPLRLAVTPAPSAI
ncbi:MAG: HAD-IA family hydrolase [Nocardioidaceae bacterium]|nr:HAD-IA family hydrolase [Nocardioidaceae bacterium]